MLDVLVVDDDDIVRECIAEALADAGHRVAQASDGESALSLLASRPFDLAICDVQMPRLDGLTLFRRLRHDSPATAVVIMTSYGRIPDVIGSLREGAADYVTKPFDPDEFTLKVVGPIAERRALLKRFEEARTQFVATETGVSLAGMSLVMRQLVDRVSVVGKSDASVFLTGDRGTGKKLVARMLHAQSPRREGPFVIVPCASLPERMFESELREVSGPLMPGHRDGWFRAAEGGTLVLDGIDGLPLAAQSNLLRVIDEPAVRARRSQGWQPLGVRIISTSHTSPREMLAAEERCAPLLFRLNPVQLRLPSLRERDGDLYVLVCHFLREFTPPGCRMPGITPGAWKALSAHAFPGNVRELGWIVEHAVAASGGGNRLPAPAAGGSRRHVIPFSPPLGSRFGAWASRVSEYLACLGAWVEKMKGYLAYPCAWASNIGVGVTSMCTWART